MSSNKLPIVIPVISSWFAWGIVGPLIVVVSWIYPLFHIGDIDDYSGEVFCLQSVMVLPWMLLMFPGN